MSAHAKAQDMVDRDYYDHIPPDGVWHPNEYYGSGWTAENILVARTGYSVDDMVQSWMNSEGHRWNMLKDGCARLRCRHRDREV